MWKLFKYPVIRGGLFSFLLTCGVSEVSFAVVQLACTKHTIRKQLTDLVALPSTACVEKPGTLCGDVAVLVTQVIAAKVPCWASLHIGQTLNLESLESKDLKNQLEALSYVDWLVTLHQLGKLPTEGAFEVRIQQLQTDFRYIQDTLANPKTAALLLALEKIKALAKNGTERVSQHGNTTGFGVLASGHGGVGLNLIVDLGIKQKAFFRSQPRLGFNLIGNAGIAATGGVVRVNVDKSQSKTRKATGYAGALGIGGINLQVGQFDIKGTLIGAGFQCPHCVAAGRISVPLAPTSRIFNYNWWRVQSLQRIKHELIVELISAKKKQKVDLLQVRIQQKLDKLHADLPDLAAVLEKMDLQEVDLSLQHWLTKSLTY